MHAAAHDRQRGAPLRHGETAHVLRYDLLRRVTGEWCLVVPITRGLDFSHAEVVDTEIILVDEDSRDRYCLSRLPTGALSHFERIRRVRCMFLDATDPRRVIGLYCIPVERDRSR